MPPSTMPTLDFNGKQFVHSHHLSVPFRELMVDSIFFGTCNGAHARLDFCFGTGICPRLSLHQSS